LLLISREEDISIPVPVGVFFMPDPGTEEDGLAAYTDEGRNFSCLRPRGQPSVPPPQDGNDWKPAERWQFLFQTYGKWTIASNTSTGVSFLIGLRKKVRLYAEFQEGKCPVYQLGPAEKIPMTVTSYDAAGRPKKAKIEVFKPTAQFTDTWVLRPHEVFGPCTVALSSSEDSDPIKVMSGPSARGVPLIVADGVFGGAVKSGGPPISPRFTIPPPLPIEDDEVRF
jgi:hypothetical protein